MGSIVSAVAAVVVGIVHLVQALQKPPTRPAPMPENTGKSPEELRKEAQQELGIDPIHSYNFGFAGNSGTGKSSLINALLGLDDDAPGAAKVDETECTTKIAKYSHSEYKHVVFWDIPGGGTMEHSAHSYFMDKKLYAFDMIIIIGANRFTELDVAIASSAKQFNTPMVFVRSKSDVDIDSRSRRQRRPKKEVKQEIRQEIISNMVTQLPENVRDREKFVISSWVFHKVLNVEEYGLDEGNLVKYVVEVARNRRN